MGALATNPQRAAASLSNRRQLEVTFTLNQYTVTPTKAQCGVDG
jgi:hypothetical protein